MNEEMFNELQETLSGINNIKVKLDKDAYMPVKKTKASVGFDLTAIEDVIWTPAPSQCMVKTGVYLEIPEGMEGQIRLRSSMAKTCTILPHGIGTIDSDYRGELLIPLLYLGLYGEMSTRPKIKRGERVAQIVFNMIPRVNLMQVDTLSETERGSGSFGSTGR